MERGRGVDVGLLDSAGERGMGPGDLKKEEEGFAGWGTSEIIVLNPPGGREGARLKPAAT